MNTLNGQVIVVTGGGRGIGAAAAAKLAHLGARVAIGDVDEAAAAETAARLPGALGLHLDVTDTASYEAFLRHVSEEFGPIDVLVANAGVMWVGHFADEPEQWTRRQFAVNVEGVIRGFKLATPAMAARGRGHVVVVASAASRLAPPGEAAYAATKHAVYGYCTAVREELRGTGIAVSVLMPAVVATELAAGTTSGRLKTLTPDDVAGAVLALIRSRRPELSIPTVAGVAAVAVAVVPARVRGRLQRFLVPNQLLSSDPVRRSTYQQEEPER